MSFFGIGKKTDRYGIIIDVGSGSVLTAIVHSDQKNDHPTIVWSHRIHAPLKNIDSLEKSAKAVMTALVSASMQLDAEGRKALHDYNKSAVLTEVQCSICAPWSYTVTKTISYQQENPFLITEDLVEDLMLTIQEKIDNELKENEEIQNLGLQVVTRANIGLTTNGYRVEHPEGSKAQELTISQTSVVAQNYLIDAVDEMREKLFSQTSLRKISFILMLYKVTRELLSQTYDVCLIDITYEASEIGIVRDGILTYSTHTPFGTFSLAREIAAVTGVPLHEAFGYLHTEKPYAFMDKLSKGQKDDVEAIFESFVGRITDLFHETGDTLSIPKKMSLHTDVNSEPVFLDLIEKAAKRSTKVSPSITPISNEIIKQTYKQSVKEGLNDIPTDTALLLSAQFFHKEYGRKSFEYL